MPGLRATAYEFGAYRLDPLGRTLQRDGELLPLAPKAVEVLLELIRHSGSVVGKQDLMDAVWPETFVPAGKATPTKPTQRPRRKMSAAARKAIGDAQRKRWAAQRATAKK